MKTRMKMAAAVLLAAGSAASAQLSLSTGFGATTVLGSGDWIGNFFDVTVLHGDGITISGWDIHSNQASGVPVTVQIWVKQGTHVGYHMDPTAWTLLGEYPTTSQGPGTGTMAPLGDLFIPSGETWGVRVGIQPGSLRYYNATQTNADPIFSNDHLIIDLTEGRAQGNLFASGGNVPRGWSGTIFYELGNTVTSGACCLPDGTCDLRSGTACVVAGGVFHGTGTDCASIPPCPQPGACCLPDGSCEILSEAQCADAEGSYHGHGTDCATIPPCPVPGACCLMDGTCDQLSEVQCDALGGTFQGGGTNCFSNPCPGPGACCMPGGHCVEMSEAGCAAHGGNFSGAGTTCWVEVCPEPLHDNGSLITEPFGGFQSANLSRADAVVTTLGSSVSLSGAGPHFRIADDFTVSDPEGWTVENVIVYGYATGLYPLFPPASPWTGANVNLWNGIPGEPGSNVVASSNAMVATGFAGIYRVSNTAPNTNTDRPVMFAQVDFNNVHLPAGDYWVDYQLTGTSGFTPYIMDVDQFGVPYTPVGNGRQLTSAGWVETSVPSGSPTPQAVDFPFAILGTIGGSCYADCDGNGILNIDDFLCFINFFASQDPYADCDNNGIFNIDDFLCFINQFAQGCP